MAAYIEIKIENCKQCPHFTAENQYSSDGWDRMEDWMCNKTTPDKTKIQGAVEWHEESKIAVPDWCPILVKEPKSRFQPD